MSLLVSGLGAPCLVSPTLSLFLKHGRLEATEFILSAEAIRVRTSSWDPRCGRLQWRAQLAAFVCFIAEQAAWFYDDPSAAAQEIREAVSMGREVPASAPLFTGPRNSVAATLAELFRTWRNDSVKNIFAYELGREHQLFVAEAFRQKANPPVVWLNAALLPQSGINVFCDGELLTDPVRLRALAREIELSRPRDWKPRDN